MRSLWLSDKYQQCVLCMNSYQQGPGSFQSGRIQGGPKVTES